MLTEKEFELIKEIAFSKGQLTQRELAEAIVSAPRDTVWIVHRGADMIN